jgi:hypothetical protein
VEVAKLVEPGAVVVVDCMNPKEKLWGVLLRLDGAGAVLRGLDLASVEDWLQQEKAGEEAFIGPTTVFIPTHRLQRIYLEESRVGMLCFADRYRESCGGEVKAALLGELGDQEASTN